MGCIRANWAHTAGGHEDVDGGGGGDDDDVNVVGVVVGVGAVVTAVRWLFCNLFGAGVSSDRNAGQGTRTRAVDHS